MDNNTNNQLNKRAFVQRQSSLPAKLQNNHSQQDNHFQFPDPDTYYGHSSEDNLDNHDGQEDNQWIFSPRSATPTSEFQEHIMEPPDPAEISHHRKQNPKVLKFNNI